MGSCQAPLLCLYDQSHRIQNLEQEPANFSVKGQAGNGFGPVGCTVSTAPNSSTQLQRKAQAVCTSITRAAFKQTSYKAYHWAGFGLCAVVC